MSGHILLGVTGSIAAYKAAELTTDLIKRGYDVRVTLTPGATRFVAPLTFAGLTGQPAPVEVWEGDGESGPGGHLGLAQWADILVVAPASAGAIARLALGLVGDMLGACALAFTGPLVVAPAMESAMFAHPATRGHLETLRERGATIVGPDTGRLASGAWGIGRMAEVGAIAAAVTSLGRERDLQGYSVLVTAGPTYEPIDSVRFIGNRSSGKMGYAIAGAAATRGARTTLISGPTALSPPPGARFVSVETAMEMRDAVLAATGEVDVVIMAAAVADFRPLEPIEGKLRRAHGIQLDLEPTTDIAAAAARAAPHAVHVGFALEPDDVVEAARRKLQAKGLDLVVGNAISPTHNPFGANVNTAVLVDQSGVETWPELPKERLAHVILDATRRILTTRDGNQRT